MNYPIEGGNNAVPSEPSPHVQITGNAAAAQGEHASDSDADLRLPLAAIAAVCRPDRGAGRLCRAVPEGAVAPVPAFLRFFRTADHAGGAGPDRCGDDLQPADDGDRR